MSLGALKTAAKVIGVKQALKAVGRGQAEKVYLAADAEGRVVEPLRRLCAEQAVATEEVPTMVDLGRACGIEVGAAAVAKIKAAPAK